MRSYANLTVFARRAARHLQLVYKRGFLRDEILLSISANEYAGFRAEFIAHASI